MINTDVLYNTFIYFFTGYGVMACTINLFNFFNKINKVKVNEINFKEINFNEDEVNEEIVVENFEYIKLGKRKKII